MPRHLASLVLLTALATATATHAGGSGILTQGENGSDGTYANGYRWNGLRWNGFRWNGFVWNGISNTDPNLTSDYAPINLNALSVVQVDLPPTD